MIYLLIKKIMLNKWFNIIFDEVKLIMKSTWRQFVVSGVLIWFLIFILNIFLWMSFYSNYTSNSLKDKIWMYFYINEDKNVYNDIINLKWELEKKWLKVTFLSKEQAFNSLQKKLPNVFNNLEKIWITNKIPWTLYVMFDNNKEYNILKWVMLKYRKIILNIKDLDKWDVLSQQENIVIKTINFTNFITRWTYLLVCFIWFVILFLLWFILESLYNKFYKQLSIKKTLWASNIQILQSFVFYIFIVLALWSLWSLLLSFWSFYLLNKYILDLFMVDLSSFFSYINILFAFIFELFIFLFISFIFSLKKIWTIKS